MKKRTIFIGLLVVGLIAAFLIWNNFLRTGPSTSKLKAELRINSQELYSAFENDEASANGQYQGKIVEVIGELESVDAEEGSLPILTLKTEGFGGVRCTMESNLTSEELAQLKLNTTIIIKGECVGYLLDVEMGKCILIEDS